MKRSVKSMAGILATLALLFTLAPALPALAGPGVDVNTATEEELVALPGIGPSKAKAIIEYRQAHPFQSVDELLNVRGIGEHTLESLKDKISVGSVEKSSTKR